MQIPEGHLGYHVAAVNSHAADGLRYPCGVTGEKFVVLRSAGKLDQIKIVGVDGSEDGIAAIKEGKMFASASQDPVEIGKQSIEIAYKVIAGETVEADIKVPSALVTAETLKAGE